jgi:DNA-binding FadR family transcriptional regulator
MGANELEEHHVVVKACESRGSHEKRHALCRYLYQETAYLRGIEKADDKR